MTIFKWCWRIGWGGLFAVFGLRILWLQFEHYDLTERHLFFMFWREHIVAMIAAVAIYIGEQFLFEE